MFNGCLSVTVLHFKHKFKNDNTLNSLLTDSTVPPLWSLIAGTRQLFCKEITPESNVLQIKEFIQFQANFCHIYLYWLIQLKLFRKILYWQSLQVWQGLRIKRSLKGNVEKAHFYHH